MHTFAQKPKAVEQTTSGKSTTGGRGHLGQSPDVKSILRLQRTIGNQAVLRMLQTDAEEPEADLTRPALPRFGHDFSRIPIHPPAAGAIQTKLEINKPGDSYEREADRMAEQVMRTPEPQLQRACACGGECPKCRTDQPGREHESLQTKRVQAGDTGQTVAPPIVREVLASRGQPLDAPTRAFMEPRFGHDFSRVRVHTGSTAAESARAVDALAFTVGRDVVFGAHQYAPGSAQGRRLLAHELTHTLQQSSTPASLTNALRIGPSDDVHEQEAETEAARVVESGEGGPAPLRAFASAPSLQRAPKKGTPTPPAPTRAKKAKCVEQLATEKQFSRGNDDLRECQYETALITVSLWWNPCVCSAKVPNAPLKLKYHALMGGKRLGEPKKLETQASEEVAGRGKEEKTRKPIPAIGLRETGDKRKRPVRPLKHTKRPPTGDPGDFLDADYTPPQTLACTGGSANGSVDVGKSQTIKWSISTDAAQTVKDAAIKLVEHTPPKRSPTPTRELSKEKPYPPFPGEPRDPKCTCDDYGVCWNEDGDDLCIETAPDAKVGP